MIELTSWDKREDKGGNKVAYQMNASGGTAQDDYKPQVHADLCSPTLSQSLPACTSLARFVSKLNVRHEY